MIKEWLTTFYNDYVCINLKSYSNIGIDFEIVKILIAIAFAAILCGIMLDYHNKYTYALVKQLLRHDAVSEEKGKTLGELGLADNKAIKRALLSGGKLKKLVAMCGATTLTYEEYKERERLYKVARKENKHLKEDEFIIGKTDFNSARFYIREESKSYAMRIFGGADVTVIRTALRSVLIIMVTAIIIALMPDILEGLNNILAK